jgi:hypothetical protein
MKQNIIKVLLSIVIIVLGYLVINSIREPLKFQKERVKREKIVIKRLIDIRSVQLAFKGVHSAYATTFDTLIGFINNGKIPVVNIIPDPNDTTFTRTISDTIAYVNVIDSLFKGRQNFNPQNLRYIPFSEGQEFIMDAGSIEISSTIVNVFEVKALYKDILLKMDEQLLRNLLKKQRDSNKFEGIKVGSMKEASTDGNWEF